MKTPNDPGLHGRLHRLVSRPADEHAERRAQAQTVRNLRHDLRAASDAMSDTQRIEVEVAHD